MRADDRTIIADVGYNPFRRHVRRTSDFVLVAAALAVTAALVLWAFGVV